MLSSPMKRLAALSLCICLTACTPALRGPPELLRAEASYGDGVLYFKVTNISGKPLLYWDNFCHLNAQVMHLDGTPAPSIGSPGTWCNLRANLQPQVLAANDFLVERKETLWNSGTYLLSVSVDMDVAVDQRSDEQRRRYGQPPLDSGCLGIPCPQQYGYGMAPDDPLNPMKMPRQKLRISAPTITIRLP